LLKINQTSDFLISFESKLVRSERLHHHVVDGTPLIRGKKYIKMQDQSLVAIHPHPNQRLWVGNSATFVKKSGSSSGQLWTLHFHELILF
jgi:hypothetical protein